MGIENRPYVGTWQLSGMSIVQHSPDALVYINGDTSIPGCYKCNSYIDVQKYITNVSVDASNDPSGASANISMSIPRHSPDSFSRDADHILRPGLEVTIYMRGYFPVKGQFKDVPAQETGGVDISEMISYPYYHVFHGVTTQVDFGYSGGFREATISCNSMLYFWQYQNISENGAAFGTRPTNTGLEYSLVGNRFNGWTPYSIVYSMYADVVGAAGSVAYALRDKTNVAAKDYRGKSLYSLTIDYWNERFKQKMINLRMHGASGEVLSTAQAVFLSRLNGKQIKNIIDAQYGGVSGEKNNILSAAKSLGLIKTVKDPVTGEERNYNPVTLLDAIRPPGEDEKVKGLELNIADQQAFVQDVGQYGQVAIFETTYESKLDIINKVLEVTGWEFYQDVDGDFVFKPPMYNLDTKGSQVYVIRAVDIISINQVEKEPECTYVTTTSNHFKNITGTGTEGEFGVRGQYMDYKLIAQYGWRPFSFESSYFTDKESLFYNAMNRLDVQNAGINSASLTIPIRPELRPGYPVYIEPYDCYYYIQGLSHNMSYGSQCTTTLTLTAKRKKFYAPGKPEETGIKSIDMRITTLPPKPLEVLDGNGNPRLVGFPNVVMALDPEAINPVYFAAGFDLNNISDPVTLRNILKYAVGIADLGITKDPDLDVYIIPFSKTENTELNPNDNIDTQPSGGRYTFDQLLGGAGEYYNSVTPSEKMIKLRDEIDKLMNKFYAATGEHYSAYFGIGTGPAGNIPSSFDNQAEVDRITNEVNKKWEELNGLIEGQEQKVLNNPDALVIRDLVRSLEEYGGNRVPTEDFPNPSKTANMLTILSEKKSMFSNNAPGHYRYYSCSHPSPEHQGPLTILAGSSNGGSTSNQADGIQATKEGFLNYEPMMENGLLVEAKIGEIDVTRGFRVTRRTKSNEVIPTDSIQTMTFAKHEFDATLYSSNYKHGLVYLGLNDDYKEYVRKKMVYKGESEDTIVNQSSLKSLWDKMVEFDPTSPILSFPGEIQGVSTSEPFSTFRNTFFSNYVPSDGGDNYMNETYTRIRDNLVGILFTNVGGYLEQKYTEFGVTVSDQNLDKEVRKGIEKTFQELVSKASFGKVNQPTKSKKKEEKTEKKPFYTPIFPVSDAGGYTVIGSYRYGRGLQVYAHSSMEELARIDPLKYADPQSVENYILSLQGKAALNESSDTSANPQEANLIKAIKDNQNAPESAKKEIDGYFNSDLSNWMARIGEGVNKIPVSNAAVFLSNITPNKSVCTCRGRHADVYTEAFGTDKFMSVIPSDLDELSAFQSSLSVQQSLKWTRVKNALAGESPDAKRGNVYEMSKSLKSAYTSLFDSTGDAINDLGNAAEERFRENNRSLENNINTVAEGLRSLGEGTATIGGPTGPRLVTQQNEDVLVTDPIARAAKKSGRDAEEARRGNPRSMNREEWDNISSSDEGDR